MKKHHEIATIMLMLLRIAMPCFRPVTTDMT